MVVKAFLTSTTVVLHHFAEGSQIQYQRRAAHVKRCTSPFSVARRKLAWRVCYHECGHWL